MPRSLEEGRRAPARVAWRLRLHPTPRGDNDWHVIEQQAYLRVGERIDVIDLLCSGFMPDRHR